MTIKKTISLIHRWLGLTSGLVVFIIAITGCIYAFQEEIQNLTQPFRFVTAERRAMLPPSTLKAIGEKELPGKHLHAVLYGDAGKAAQVIFFNFEPDYYYYLVYVNPYTGAVLKVENMQTNFFRFILNGHFYLWLPPHVGQPLVASATLVFFVMLMSGFILWWPKNKSAAKQRFSINWKARWRRKNYDLHNVLGFYVLSIALVLCISGLVWGFEWFAKSYYTVAGGEKSLTYIDPVSDTTIRLDAAVMAPIDAVWQKMKLRYPNAQILEVHMPEGVSGSIAANANPDAKTYYKTDYVYFDQYTLNELPVDHIYARYADASVADKLMRMNYDIHVGAILGLPGKVLAFLASLICASLPVTGTYIWWGRRNKDKKEKKKKLKENARITRVKESIVQAV